MWPPRSRLGLGLAALGRPGYINLGHADALAHDYDPAHMERHCHDVLDAAYALGIRYFDAARSYGRAEPFLAHWLPKAEVSIGSKWGYVYTADWRVDADKHEVKDHSLANFERQWAETRALLRVDLYQIHSATLDSGVLDDEDVLAALRQLKDEGVRVGLSLSGPRQAETLQRALSLGLFDAVQATWNLLEPSVGPMLQRAHDSGMFVTVKEAMANGRLLETLREPARDLNVGPDALALAAALAQPFCDVVLSGAVTVEQVRQNAACLTIRELPPLELAEPPEVYWSTRSRLPWN